MDNDQQLIWEAYTKDKIVNESSSAEDFVVQVSEMIAAYNERGISFDMNELMDNVSVERMINDRDLILAAQIFEDDFKDPDAGWEHHEVSSIREWFTLNLSSPDPHEGDRGEEWSKRSNNNER